MLLMFVGSSGFRPDCCCSGAAGVCGTRMARFPCLWLEEINRYIQRAYRPAKRQAGRQEARDRREKTVETSQRKLKAKSLEAERVLFSCHNPHVSLLSPTASGKPED